MAYSWSASMMRRLACGRSSVSRYQPSTTLLQRRGLATLRETPYERRTNKTDGTYTHFDIAGKVFVVTGGGQGLGFSIAQGLVGAGGIVHVLDRSSKPTKEFEEVKKSAKSEFDGVLEYHQVDVTDGDSLGTTVADIAAQKQRLDGLVAGSWRLCNI